MKAWNAFCSRLREEMGEAAYSKWVEPMQVIRYDAANLFLEVHDPFHALWFEEHLRPLARKELVNNNGRPIKIHLKLRQGASPDQISSRPPPPAPTFSLQFDELDPDATLTSFITSTSNQMALSILQEVIRLLTQQPLEQFSKEEVKSYNPLYIHGPSGSGKTHLLMASASALTNAGIKATYVRAATFTAHFVNAIRAGEMSLFRQTYRNQDVLIIDDVQDFSRKGATQEELFHTFNTLHLEEKRIILGSSHTPQELDAIEPRLISRFEWGMMIPILPLSQEEMPSLLTKRTANRQYPLNKKVETLLLQEFGKNSKYLVKALDALILRENKRLSETITEADARHILSDLLKEQETLLLTPEKILAAVAAYYAIPQGDILGKSQKREMSLPRQISMYLCREKLHLPFIKIGLLFDRDHSTVMSSIRRIQKDHEQGANEVTQALHAISGKLE